LTRNIEETEPRLHRVQPEKVAPCQKQRSVDAGAMATSNGGEQILRVKIIHCLHKNIKQPAQLSSTLIIIRNVF